MAHNIKGDIIVDGLAGSGTRAVAVDSTGKLIEETATEKTNGTRLALIDLTNGGSNNLQNIDIIWQSAWDAYDYVDFVISDARNGTFSSQVGWALATVAAPTTWLQFAGNGNEAFSWTDYLVPSGTMWHASSRMHLQAHQKRHMCGSMNYSVDAVVNPNSSDSSVQGVVFDYNGTSLSDSNSASTWLGWNTGSKGLNNYIVRLIQEGGAFNNGTLRIIGYKYPS